MNATQDSTAPLVLGAGSWATALVRHLTESGWQPTWWVRRPEARAALKDTGENQAYLPGVKLPLHRLRLADTLPDALEATETVVLVVPSAHVHHHLKGLPTDAFQGKTVLAAIKGLLPAGLLPHEYMQTAWGVPAQNYLALLGPGHAEEVAAGRQTHLTLCGAAPAEVRTWALRLQAGTLTVAQSPDVAGGEWMAALKNLYALGMGVVVGLGQSPEQGLGDNFRAAFAACLVREWMDWLPGLAPLPGRNPAESLYLGDFIVTAFSEHSRNRRYGAALGAGHRPDATGMVAEGVFVAQRLRERAPALALPPIAASIVAVVLGELTPHQALAVWRGVL